MAKPDRTYGGQSAAERAAGRRERLVAATVALLGELGEPRTTMTAICARAGLTERYFYESFRRRDEALTAALDAVSTEIADAALAAVRASDGTPEQRVRAAVAAVVEVLAATPAKGRVITIESSASPPLRERRRALVGWFADLVATQSATIFGAPASGVGHSQAIVFVAGYAELVGSWLLGREELSQDEIVDLGARLLTTMVRT